jgi:hypothetical protein
VAQGSVAGRLVAGFVLAILVPSLLILTIVVLGALASAGIFAVQAVTGTALVGTVTDARGVTVVGRRGTGYYCSGRLQPSGGGDPVLVRIYPRNPCNRAVGQDATLVPGVLAPVTRLWTGRRDRLPFSGVLGTADGALTGSAWSLLTENGVLIFIGVLVLGMDTVLIARWRRRARVRRRRRRDYQSP